MSTCSIFAAIMLLNATPALAQTSMQMQGNPTVNINVSLNSFNPSTGFYDNASVGINGSPCPNMNIDMVIPVQASRGPDDALIKAKDQIDKVSSEVRNTAARCADFRH